jgi:hypothetical protein
MSTRRLSRLVVTAAVALFAGSLAAVPATASTHRARRHHRHVSQIPQHNGGDHDGDNNGRPSDGDGNV